MIRRLALLSGAAALSITSVAAVVSPAQASDPHGVTCGLTGSATFKPGLTTTAADGSFSFTGDLAGCQSTDATVTDGTVKATGAGNSSCAEGTAAGTAIISWSNKKTTVVSFTTQNVAAAVQVSTTVIKSTKVGTITYTTDESATPVGDSGLGALAFQADPTQCNTATGLTTADFQGQIGSGNNQ
jgi:hypothetical protein